MSLIELKSRPSATDLRWFGPILLVFVAMIGTIAYFRFDAPRVAVTLWSVGAVVPALYFAVPALRIPIYQLWMTVFFPVGWTVSHVVLLVLFYGIVTPTALIMRLVRYDPMKRRWDPKAASYWTEHRTGGETSRYLKQH